jgi:hypothetical protein
MSKKCQCQSKWKQAAIDKFTTKGWTMVGEYVNRETPVEAICPNCKQYVYIKPKNVFESGKMCIKCAPGSGFTAQNSALFYEQSETKITYDQKKYNEIYRMKHFSILDALKLDTVECVYAIKCLDTQKMYIGYTCDVHSRLRGHILALDNKRPTINKVITEDWHKYGSDTFVISIIDDTNNTQHLRQLEEELLQKIDPTFLYNQIRHRPKPTISRERADFFWSRIDQKRSKKQCWEWTGQISKGGYGTSKFGKREYLCHRIAYFLHYKVWPGALLVRHTCDNRKCCNPYHLELGSHKDNGQDKSKRKRCNPRSSKTTKEEVLGMISMKEQGYSCRAIGEKYSMPGHYISSVLAGKIQSLKPFLKNYTPPPRQQPSSFRPEDISRMIELFRSGKSIKYLSSIFRRSVTIIRKHLMGDVLATKEYLGDFDYQKEKIKQQMS